MAKKRGSPLFGTKQYVCTACQAQSRTEGYQVTNVPKADTSPKCAFCGKSGENMQIEPKHHRFLRVGSKRVQDIVNEIDKLDKLFAYRNYEYEPADVERLFNILSKELEAKHKKYTQPTGKIRSIELL